MPEPLDDELLLAMDDLVGLAEQFCGVVESADSIDTDELLDRLDELLPLLYHHAGRLNGVAPDDLFEGDPEVFEHEGEPEAGGPEGGEWPRPAGGAKGSIEAVQAALAERLGWGDRYYRAEATDYVDARYDVEQRRVSDDVAATYACLSVQIPVFRAIDRSLPGSARESQAMARDLVIGFLSVWGPKIPYMLAGTFDALYGELKEGEEEEDL